MNKTNAVSMEVIEAFLSAIDKIDPFGRQYAGMSPQQYRRYRAGVALQASTTAEREACARELDTLADVISDEIESAKTNASRQILSTQRHAVQTGAAAIRRRSDKKDAK